jgi:hypothetical protein
VVNSRKPDNGVEMTLDNLILFFSHTVFNEKINKIPRANQGNQFEHPKFT